MSKKKPGPTYQQKPFDPAWGSADPMPVMSQQRVSAPWTWKWRVGWRVWGWEIDFQQIWPYLTRISPIFYSICWENKNTNRIWPKNHRDTARSCWDRPDLFEIHRDLIKIRLGLARSDDFWQNLADFLTTRNWLRTDLYPMKIRPPEPTPFASRWRV